MKKFLVLCKTKIANLWRKFLNYFASKFRALKEFFNHANKKTMASFFIMGLGQLLNKQIVKGILYLLIQIGGILYFVFKGGADFIGMFTLGTVRPNPWEGIDGDNSIVMLILGLLSIIIICLYFFFYISNIKDAYATQVRIEEGKNPKRFIENVKEMFDKKFYITTLFLPILGVAIFNVLPIVFMILIAFTNYGGDVVVTGELVKWVGFENFARIVTLSQFASTFIKIFGWNILWAILSTIINFFGGLGLAVLLQKKIVKGKLFWRLFPVMAYAVPGFITLIGFKFMFSYGGPINQIITDLGGSAIGFLDIDAGWLARLIGLVVNAWISVPSIMLLCTGLLANRNKDLYEAAMIDGAKPRHQFRDITLPYIFFATTPIIINQFVANFNNFGIFFFLRGKIYTEDKGYFLASDTDLLINWLYNLSVDNNHYSIGAVISLVIFIITSIIALAVYMLSPSYRREDTYK